MIKKYRKKPVVIEAAQLTSIEAGEKIQQWLVAETKCSESERRKLQLLNNGAPNPYAAFPTDWLIRIPPDTWAIMKDEEFQATYEEVKDEQ